MACRWLDRLGGGVHLKLDAIVVVVDHMRGYMADRFPDQSHMPS